MYGTFRFGQYFEDILAGVMMGATAAEVPVISVQTTAGVLASGHHEAGQRAVSRAAWDHFDAAITLLDAVSPDYVAELRAAGKFVVRIGQDRQGCDTAIAIDNAGGIRDAVSHLAEHGHTAIGFLSPGWQPDAAERYAAYRTRMAELDLPVLPMFGADLPRELSFDHQGYHAVGRFLAGRGLPGGALPCTALIVAPDLVALAFLRGLREAGVRVPDDLAVIGVDDVDEAAVNDPPLASVAISFRQVGERAVAAALDAGAGRPARPLHLVPERLVARESCGCPSGGRATVTARHTAPVDLLAAALLDAAHQGGGESGPDSAEVSRLARAVVDLLDRRSADDPPPDPREVGALARAINQLCPIDRAVQSALRGVRELGQALALAAAPAGDAERTWAVSAAVMDLCDAIRSGQLQRRMSDHVDLKRLQMSHYFIGNSLLGHDRDELRSVTWLQHTPVQAGALGLWAPYGQTGLLAVHGTYRRASPSGADPAPPVAAPSVAGPPDAAPPVAGPPDAAPPDAAPPAPLPVESFPPREVFDSTAGRGGLVVITQVRLEDSDWGLLAVSGDRILRSCLVQETFHQWSILMSVSLDQERSAAQVARQADALAAAYRTEAALLEEARISEERYALATEAARGALWDWDVAGGQVYYSSSWKALLGYRDAEIGQTPEEWLQRIHPDDVRAAREHVDRALTGAEQHLDFEHRLMASTGDYRWIACTGRLVLDESGRPARLVGSVTDVTARRLVQEQLVQEAQYDTLTGLARSALFKDRLQQVIETSRQRSSYGFVVLFIDLNGFKAVNDTFGHAVGDDLLMAVAARLRDSLRADDTAARLGGDEFAVLLRTPHPGEVDPVVERIRATITAPYEIRGQTVSVGAAIGVAVGDSRYSDADTMLHDADTAMYRDKRHLADAAARALGRRRATPGDYLSTGA